MVFTTAHVGPWSTSLNWDLRATRFGEMRLPFRQYVHSGQNERHPSDDEFHRFLQLPTELQQYIVSFCDPATLFQLMHVSFTTRQKAKKLFWSDPTTRYIIDGQWLLAGGHPRHTNDNLEALTHMQYIEVDFSFYGSVFVMEWKEGGYYTDIREGEDQRTVFWMALRRRFPRVTDVVLTEGNPNRPETPAPERATQLATGSPDGISISVSQLRWYSDTCICPSSRYLWRRNRSNHESPTWELTETSWNPRRITPPNRKYSGLVGAYQLLDHNDMDLAELDNARQIHAIQATVAYYLHVRQAPCVCPFPLCGMQFEQPDELVTHYSQEYLWSIDHDGRVPLPPCESLRSAFERHDASLELKRQRLSDEMARMKAAWGEPGSPERSTVSQQFLQQLRNDPLYAGEKAPEESEIWFRYQRDMIGQEHPPIY
ncbi:hypothetical protein BKA66DRAFT_457724 [Pyrenochaeta sp. MPI-SDFR-AT-0127]|nr:hypothetical protein BKA66DRAFT_457724 [Pyrenochaeta sp. MPI-SDFR-AT-0127]